MQYAPEHAQWHDAGVPAAPPPGQFNKVFSYPNGCLIQLQKFNLFGISTSAQDQANRRFFPGSAFMLVQPAQVKLHLAFVAGLEFLQLQFDGHQAAQMAVIEQKVKIEVVPTDAHALLALNETEAIAHFEQEGFHFTKNGGFEVFFAVRTRQAKEVEQVGVTEHYIRRHLPIAQSGQFLTDDFRTVLRQGGTLKEHAADLLPQGANAPAFHAAHFGVELAGEWVFQRQQGNEVSRSILVSATQEFAHPGTTRQTSPSGSGLNS